MGGINWAGYVSSCLFVVLLPSVSVALSFLGDALVELRELLSSARLIILGSVSGLPNMDKEDLSEDAEMLLHHDWFRARCLLNLKSSVV